MVLDKMKEGLSDMVSTLDSKLQDSLSFLSDLKDAGWDKVTKMVNDILGLAPLIEVTGFKMNDVSIDATIPPGITLMFIKEKEVDPGVVEKMLEEHKDQDLLKLIVKGLEKADALQKTMTLQHYDFKGLGMKIGIPPDISLKYVRKAD